MNLVFFAELRFLKGVLQAFALRDPQRVANALVVRAKAHQAADDGLVRSVPLARASERPVKLDLRSLRRAANESTREQSQATRPRRMRRRRTDHDGTDDV